MVKGENGNMGISYYGTKIMMLHFGFLLVISGGRGRTPLACPEVAGSTSTQQHTRILIDAMVIIVMILQY